MSDLVWQVMPGDPRFEYTVDGRTVRWRVRRDIEPGLPELAFSAE